jgi:hypothetical protein
MAPVWAPDRGHLNGLEIMPAHSSLVAIEIVVGEIVRGEHRLAIRICLTNTINIARQQRCALYSCVGQPNIVRISMLTHVASNKLPDVHVNLSKRVTLAYVLQPCGYSPGTYLSIMG